MTRFGATGLQIPQAGRSPMTCEQPATIASKIDGTSGTYTFTVSTNSVDRMGDVINQNGWVLSAYRANPVVLWQHSSGLLPVGKTTKLWIESGRLKATVQLAPADANPASGQVRALINDGCLSAASVGFRPLQFDFSNDPGREYGVNFQQVELVEWSIVNLPANPECLIDPGQGSKALVRQQANARRTLQIDLLRASAGVSGVVLDARAVARHERNLAIMRLRGV
jgi:HK97 family phage prohead protease